MDAEILQLLLEPARSHPGVSDQILRGTFSDCGSTEDADV